MLINKKKLNLGTKQIEIQKKIYHIRHKNDLCWHNLFSSCFGCKIFSWFQIRNNDGVGTRVCLSDF